MKIRVFITTLFACALAHAAAPIDGWYSSVFGGFTFISSNISTTHSGFILSSNDYEGGFNAGGRVGYQSNPLRYEGEISYLNNKLNKLNIGGLNQSGVGGYTSATVLLANIYYDFPDMVPAVAPFVGLGLGYAFVDTNFQAYTPFNTILRYDYGNSAFAYQGTAGFTYNFSEIFALNTAYRYLATDTVHSLGKTLQTHSLNLGIVYRFDGNRYK